MLIQTFSLMMTKYNTASGAPSIPTQIGGVKNGHMGLYGIVVKNRAMVSPA